MSSHQSMLGPRLKADFFIRDALTVARDLNGKLLVRNLEGQCVITRIVETEAYMGPEDKACHAYKNKRTRRTEVLFRRGGLAYVYTIYGIHCCFNVVAGEEGKPEAVFIRAVEPMVGIELLRQNRKIRSHKIEHLTNGPGKLCQALNIHKGFNGYDLVSGDDLYFAREANESTYSIVCASRINVDYAGEYKDKPWRFYIQGNRFVSVSGVPVCEQGDKC